MKELEKLHKDATSKTVAVKSVIKQEKFLGSLRPQRGHTLFEYNALDGTWNKAEFESVAVDFMDAKNGNTSPKRKVLIKKNCFYVSALNEANAIKKLNKTFKK